jgi:hypothetical protein
MTQYENLIKKQFRVLSNRGLPPLVFLNDDTVAKRFRHQQFFVLGMPQYPVARVPPKPLRVRNLFTVDNDGKTEHLTDLKGLEDFFRAAARPVTDIESAKESAAAWLRLSEEFKQDGFFTFSISKESLSAESSDNGWKANGKAIVTKGGTGEIRASLTFSGEGKLTKVEENNTVKAGVRPICQATKLLDPDPIIRQMAEKDILVMGQAARDYLDEQRASASPELRQAIDRIWQRIVQEGW